MPVLSHSESSQSRVSSVRAQARADASTASTASTQADGAVGDSSRSRDNADSIPAPVPVPATRAPAESGPARLSADLGDVPDFACDTVFDTMSVPSTPATATTSNVNRSNESNATGCSGDRRLSDCTVQTLEDYFQFFDQAVGLLEDDAETLLARLSATTLSTAYSGIGAPETVLNLLHHFLQKRCSRFLDLPTPRILSQVEVDESCRAELFRYSRVGSSGHEPCVFEDLTDFFRPDLLETIKGLKKNPSLALEVLAPTVASGEACLQHAYCHVHQKRCQLNLGV